jgi:hypothetical protein
MHQRQQELLELELRVQQLVQQEEDWQQKNWGRRSWEQSMLLKRLGKQEQWEP